MDWANIYTLPQTIDYSADKWPDKDAFRINGKGITYAALVQKANALAYALRDQGVKRWDRVGIFLDKSLESAIAIYGIWKAGAAYVPLDPQAPIARLAFIIQDCEIQVLITEDTKQEQVKQLVAETDLLCAMGLSTSNEIRTLSWDDIYTAPHESAPTVQLMEQDLAYIMYTSGSTGVPKGLMHTHYSGLSYAKLSVATYDVQPEDRLGNHAPLHFDISTFGYFSGTLAGATAVIIPDVYSKFPASLSQLMADERLTIWYSVPFALIQLLLRGVLSDRDLSALRWVLFGGEPFPPKQLRALMQHWPQARFSNVYGPAEVNQCTYYHLPTLPDEADESIPLGQIWDNTEGLVVNEADELVASGEVGELLIRSPTMMRGYWKRPDLNQQAFYYRPSFTEQNDQQQNHFDRFYRTGDLVKLQADGQYQFIGRKDHQIKTRGFRVELGEIEIALLSHEQVAEAAAFLGAELEGSQQIEAAVLLKSGASLTVSALLEHIQNRLPWYAMPTQLVIVDTFPRTRNGKIDRQQLAKNVSARS
jgi:amino acid adenylation domain-containing protein